MGEHVRVHVVLSLSVLALERTGDLFNVCAASAGWDWLQLSPVTLNGISVSK